MVVGGTLLMRPNSRIDVVGGSGGDVTITAVDAVLEGQIVANGTNSLGDGGFVDINTSGALSIGGTGIQVNGGNGDSFGGFVFFTTGGLLEVGAAIGLKPCGLGARDTLRTEMCFPLYGQELTESITPVEAGLDVFVALDKPAWCGREALLAQKQAGPRRRLVAFRMSERGAPPPRPHYPVWGTGGDGARLGETTSGTLSPSLGVGIGMAYVPIDQAQPGTDLMRNGRPDTRRIRGFLEQWAPPATPQAP